MKTSATNRKLRLLLRGVQDETLIPRPEFQRRLVWSNKHKVAFLETVLEGYPFPEIYIASGEVNSQTGEGYEMLVDGQQRISTLYQYWKGSADLKLAAGVLPFDELSKDARLAFFEYEVVMRDLGALQVSEILEIFRRINSTNYALNAMEIHNARFDGEFKKLGEELATHSFFEESRFFKTQEIRRMSDTRFCLVLICTLMSGYTNRDDVLEKYLEAYNEDFDQRDNILNEFKHVVEFINKCNFDMKSRVWKKADMFTLIVEVHRVKFKDQANVSVGCAATSLKEFYHEVDMIADAGDLDVDTKSGVYYKSAIQATNDRSNRIRRGSVIRSVLNGTFDKNGVLEGIG